MADRGNGEENETLMNGGDNVDTDTTSNGADEPDYIAIEAHLSSGCYPEKMKGRPDLKSNLRKVSSKYILLKGILHFKYAEVKMKGKSGAPAYLRVVKDVEVRKKVLKSVHEGAGETIQSISMGGHVGRDKTIQKLVDANMWWPRMNIDARQFVKTCAQCQRGNTRFDKAATKLHPIPIPSKVWHQIGVDLCSLPHTDEGFVCICVVVDYFSKWVEAKPLKTKTAHEVAMFCMSLFVATDVPAYKSMIKDGNFAMLFQILY